MALTKKEFLRVLRWAREADRRPSDFQLIFENSRINGALYVEPEQWRRIWPRGTWLQKRLAKIRNETAEK